MSANHGRRAFAALIFGVLCIGFSALFVKIAGVPGPVSAFYRLVFAGAVLLPWWLATRPSLPGRGDLLLTLAGGAFFAFDLTLWNSGLLLTSAAAATLLANNAPVWVGLGALLIFRERLAARFWTGLACAMGGMVLIVGSNAVGVPEMNRGDILSIGASLFYAAYLLTTQRARSRTDTLTFMTISVAAGAGIMLVVVLSLGLPLAGFSGTSWAALAGLGLVSHLAGWLAINYALGHLRAAAVSVTLLGQAVVTTLVAMPLLGEYLAAGQAAGGLLVLTGIYLVNSRRKPARYGEPGD